MAIKRQLGKLTIDIDLPKAVDDAGFIPLEMTTKYIYAYELMPLLHRDPFDRMLIAQAKVERIALLTGDEKLKQYDIKAIYSVLRCHTLASTSL